MYSYEDAKKLVEEKGQGHVLRFWERLDDGERAGLLSQIEALDFESIERMQDLLKQGSKGVLKSDIEPARVETLRHDDVELMVFGMDWIKFGLLGWDTFKVKEEVAKEKEKELKEKGTVQKD